MLRSGEITSGSKPGIDVQPTFPTPNAFGVSRPSIAHHLHHNRVAVESIAEPWPKVASQARQAWAGGHNPFGIGRSGCGDAQPQHVESDFVTKGTE